MEFETHYDRSDLERVFDRDFKLPDGFLFGVANAAYQVEGGLNGPGEPLNNWVSLERSGKVETSGEAIRFWTEYPEQVAMAGEMNLNAFRLGVEWARVQPGTYARTEAVPGFDSPAIEGYAEILASIMKAGMEPIVTLHHFTHPYWLGLDFWLDRGKSPLFQKYVETTTREVNELLVSEHGLNPVRYWITVNEPNCLAYLSYLSSYFPTGSIGVRKATTALDNMMEAHCRAYDTVHRVYAENGWPKPMVSYNTISLSSYYLDKFVCDLLNARRNGVARSELAGYLENGRKRWEAEIAKCPVVYEPPWFYKKIADLLNRLVNRMFDVSRYGNAVEALYASEKAEKLDFLALDFYDPFLSHFIKLPSLQDVRENRINLNAEHWEWVINPGAMRHFLRAQVINGEGLPLMIAENGMCNKVRRGVVEPREDGATRDDFLRGFLFEAMRAVADGLPLAGYLYWTMVDNYEWGSYEPRFGLRTVDRSTSPVKISPLDARGVDASATYRDLVTALRSGDTEKMKEAFGRGER
jgi:beta-glucosidase